MTDNHAAAIDAVRYVYLDTASALADAVVRWRRADTVALDTEFVRERTFYPGLGLVQVAIDGPTANDPPEIALVDPVAIDDLSPLAELLDDPTIVKILHSVSEDIEVFHHHLGTVPRPLFDTQIAAGLAGVGASMGLARLVGTLLGIHLPKGETRSNWLKRPLRDAQCHYAALDVAYLLPIFRRLRDQLATLGRSDWAAEDTAAMTAPDRFADDERWLHLDLWRKLGRGSRPPLDSRQSAALRELVDWRERHARSGDVPRGFVVPDSDLLPLARALPTSRSAIRRVRGVDERKVSRHADAVTRAIGRALDLEPEDLPARFRPGTDLSGHKKLVDRLRRRASDIAEELGIEPTLLATRRTVESLVRRHLDRREPVLPRALRGWRTDVVGQPLIDLLDSSHRSSTAL